jgi:hypothetical protein
MRPLFLLAASALALSVGACGPKTPAARAALDCPMREGDLTRTSASPDGKVCTYSTSSGAEVTLQLVSTQGGVDSALTAIETNLLAGRVKPAEDAKADAKGPDAKGEVKDDKAAKAEDVKGATSDADKAAKEAAADADKTGVHVNVADGKNDVHVALKDGKSVVVTDGDTDADGNVRVNLPGIHVVANERDDSAQVSVGPIHIDAGGDGATIRMRRDVRLRGEALNPDRRGMRAMFIYKGDDLPDGYRVVGYEAGGPKSGPITVAVVKSKESFDGDDIYNDVKRLVRKNGGV